MSKERLAAIRRQKQTQLTQARHVGTQMANLCFNLSQHPGEPLTPANAATMERLRREWDAIWHEQEGSATA